MVVLCANLPSHHIALLCRVTAPSAPFAAVRLGLQLQQGGTGVPKTCVEAAVGDTAVHITPGAFALAQAIRQASAAQLVVMLPISAGEQAFSCDAGQGLCSMRARPQTEEGPDQYSKRLWSVSMRRMCVTPML